MAQNEIVTKTLTMIDIPHKYVGNVIIESVINGEINPIEAHMAIKRMEGIFKIVSEHEGYKEAVKKEVEKHGKSATFKGHSIGVQSVHTSYDFEATNDPRWKAWKEIEQTAKEQRELLEEELKAGWPNEITTFNIRKRSINIQELPAIIMEPSGEEVTIYPPIKKQKIGTVVRFAKENII